MFNFTTQTVYNNIDSKNLIISSGKKPVLRIGNTRFDADLVSSVQVKLPQLESLAEVEFDLTKLLDFVTGDGAPEEITARFALYLGLSMNSQDALYANDLLYKGKPLYIEFPVKAGDTVDVIAKRVEAIANKYMLLVNSEKVLNITKTATAANDPDPAVGKIKFTGVNGYQQIKKAVLQWFNPEAKTVDCCTYGGDYEDVIVGVPVIYEIDGSTGLAVAADSPAKKMGEAGVGEALTNKEAGILPGIEAFGDYNWIIHNLRLPTAANTGFWAPTKAEMPVPGQTYTQFIVTLVKDRDGIAGNAVGQRVTSVTTHVLYVAGKAAMDGTTTTTPADKVYNAFFTATGLNIAGKKGVIADTALQDPYRTN